MLNLFFKFMSGYGSTKMIKISQDLTKVIVI